MPVLPDPCRDPPAGGLELRAGRTPRDARHAVPIRLPGGLEAQKGEAPLPAGVKTAEPQETGLLRRDLEIEFRQPLREHPREPFGVVLLAEGPHPSSRPGESHPQALTDPDVNVSAHPAPTVQPLPDG